MTVVPDARHVTAAGPRLATLKSQDSGLKPMRAGAVSYLNTKPLIHEWDRLVPDVQLVLDHPSRLADSLAAGRLDVALIPSIEFF